ncbi:hypothetical protein [Calothrix sp. 336/3]|uniref:hypothetical protein n=1 Tax=Calothrix sp. 336/3 TaxID=1337936 RepID=UPI0004E393CE|nr:hypothetical protein [Calothrix sp. 336/3]AKG23719.1 hypothetical protein IJ00_22675 [Calothrix sp. 336/3]
MLEKQEAMSKTSRFASKPIPRNLETMGTRIRRSLTCRTLMGLQLLAEVNGMQYNARLRLNSRLNRVGFGCLQLNY